MVWQAMASGHFERAGLRTGIVVGVCLLAFSALAWGESSVTINSPSKEGATFDFSIEDGGEPDKVEFVEGGDDCDSEAVPVNGDYYNHEEEGEYYYIANEGVSGLRLRIGYEEEKKGEGGEEEGSEYVCAKQEPSGSGQGSGKYKYRERSKVEDAGGWSVADDPSNCQGEPPSSEFDYICSSEISEEDQGNIGDQSPVIQWRER